MATFEIYEHHPNTAGYRNNYDGRMIRIVGVDNSTGCYWVVDGNGCLVGLLRANVLFTDYTLIHR